MLLRPYLFNNSSCFNTAIKAQSISVEILLKKVLLFVI